MRSQETDFNDGVWFLNRKNRDCCTGNVFEDEKVFIYKDLKTELWVTSQQNFKGDVGVTPSNILI